MTVVGGMLLTIGAAHLALGAVWFHSTFDAMAAGELVGSAQRTWGASQTDAEREQVFWFQVVGSRAICRQQPGSV